MNLLAALSKYSKYLSLFSSVMY